MTNKLRQVSRRTDSNQTELVKLFRQLGASVLITSNIGKGAPDLVVGINGYNILVEVKDGTKPPSRRKLTEPERIFHESWRGSIVIIECEQDAISLINKYRSIQDNE